MRARIQSDGTSREPHAHEIAAGPREPIKFAIAHRVWDSFEFKQGPEADGTFTTQAPTIPLETACPWGAS